MSSSEPLRIGIVGASPTGSWGELRSGPALNVSRAYLEFRAAITQGRPASPDFAAALARHQTLDCIERAAREGRRIELAA